MTISQTGFADLATTYTSTVLTATKLVTVTNGTVPARYNLVLDTTSSAPAAFAGDITVRTWLIAAPGVCATTPPTGTPSRSWATGVTLSGDLAAAATVRYCVQTSITSAAAGNTPGTTMTARMDLKAHAGNWTSPVTTVTTVQKVANTAPRALVAVQKTHSAISMSWSAPDDKTVTRYQVYRGIDKISEVQSATTFTDTDRVASTQYEYTVRAVDGSNNVLAASNVLAVTTNKQPPAPNVWFHVVTADGSCVEAAAPQVEGRVLATTQCSTAPSSSFQFVAEPDSTYKIAAKTTGRVWDSRAKKQGSSDVTLSVEDGGPKKLEQRFTLTSGDDSTGGFQIRSVQESRQCMQSGATGAALTMQACVTAPVPKNQQFTLVEVAP
ncbi:fibronectin type III domain-containing protein [Cryobacterium serini]|uniref:fibronectin type III domain-containing protein n=1 Tax=Cryobacterium serini TaxID=1259201 RepID=UPI0010695728|nr:fibronectin type III domain-containing protein [Cryobacterium serini]